MKLILVLLIAVLLGTFFATSSGVSARHGHTLALITARVPVGLDDPTSNGGVDLLTASLNRSQRQPARPNTPAAGTRGYSVEGHADVRQGTVRACLSSTLWNNDLDDSTAEVGVTVLLRDEFLITSGSSGLINGDPVQVFFASQVDGLITVRGNPLGGHSVTFTSRVFPAAHGGQHIAELAHRTHYDRSPADIPIDGVRAGRIINVEIGQTVRMETSLVAVLGPRGIIAGLSPSPASEIEARGEGLLLLTEGFLDIGITSAGGAPLRAVGGDQSLHGSSNRTVCRDNLPGRRRPAPAPQAMPDPQAAPDPQPIPDPAAASSPDSAVDPLPFFPGSKQTKDSAQNGKVRGKSVIGQIGSPFARPPGNAAPLGAIVVLTEQGEVTLLVDADTRISAPPDNDVGLEVLTNDPPTRVAVLTNRSPLANDGTLSEQLVTALKITVIPQSASRQHRRVVVAEKTAGNTIQFVDELVGVADLNANTGTPLGKGEQIIVLVQKGNSGVRGPRVKAVFKADLVAKRLERWADKEAGRSGDAFKLARIDGLLEKHLDAQSKKLDKIAAKAPKGLKDVFGQTVKRMVQTRNAAKARLRTRGNGKVDSECVLSLLGRVPATKRDLTANEQRRVNAECTGAKAGTPPKVELRLSDRSKALIEGSTITIGARAEDDGEVVSLQFVINGVEQPLINDVAGFTGLEFPVPLGIRSLEVKVKATDGDGNFVWESVDLPVAQDPAPIVGGARLGNGWNLTGNGWNLTGNGWNLTGQGWNLLEGEKYSISVQADDNREVESVNISVFGKSYPATLKDGKWIAEISIPAGPPVSAKIASNIIPHVFAGTAIIDGRPAPDGTSVTAWIPSAAATSTSTIEITAVDNLSKVGLGTQEIKVERQMVQVGEGTVTGGVYSLLVHQRQGGSFAGRTITFKLGDLDAGQTGVWEAGAGDELNLYPGPNF